MGGGLGEVGSARLVPPRGREVAAGSITRVGQEVKFYIENFRIKVIIFQILSMRL